MHSAVAHVVRETDYCRRRLRDNWDGPGSVAPPGELLDSAVGLVTAYAVKRSGIRNPTVYATRDGGVDLTWSRMGASVTACIRKRGHLTLQFKDFEKEDNDMSEDLESGEAAIVRLSQLCRRHRIR